jgi:hypothetical protein
MEPRLTVGPAVVEARSRLAPQRKENKPEGPLGVGFEAAASMGLKHAGEPASNRSPAKPVFQKGAVDIATQQPTASQLMEPRLTVGPAVVEARSRLGSRRKAEPVCSSESSSDTVAVNPHQQPDAFHLAEEEVFTPSRLEKKKKASTPVFEGNAQRARHRQEAEEVSPEVHEEKIQMPLTSTQEAAAQGSEARLAAALAQQANQTLELFSPLVDVAEKSTLAREASGPQVHIGTIEVIVESAPVAQQKSSPSIGFTRDLGRSYQRRL